MGKFKTMLVGAALALPFTALGAGSSTAAGQPAMGLVAPAGIDVGTSSAYTCCWVFHLGRWYCIPYC